MSQKPILYSWEFSPPVRAVWLTARYIGLDLDIKPIDIFKLEHLAPEFVKINPQHTVPVLDDNGNKLWDSHAISTYLIGKYAKDDKLYSKDLYERAKIDQRLHFDSSVLFPRIRNSTICIFFQKRTEFTPEIVAGGYEAYDHVETFLKDDPYIVGDHLTLADLAFVTSIAQMEAFAPLDSVKYPKILGWLKRLQTELPYLQELNTLIAAKVKNAFVKQIKENQNASNQ